MKYLPIILACVLLESCTLFQRTHVSDIPIESLPKDFDYSDISRQEDYMDKGAYLSLSGILKPLPNLYNQENTQDKAPSTITDAPPDVILIFKKETPSVIDLRK